MLQNISVRVLVLAVLVLVTLSTAAAQETGPVPVEIVSDGAAMRGQFFKADCAGPCPTLLLVPGFPGSAQHEVLGLGVRLSEGGISVLVFNPRGLPQSEGTMTFLNTLDDIGAAFNWLHEDEVAERFSIDTASIAIGGYSFGGGTSMAYAARDARVRAVVSLAGTDHAEFIREYERNPSFTERVDRILSAAQAPEGPARFDRVATLHELAENQDVFGLRENAARLADRRILLIGGWEDHNVTVDQHMLPLYRSLKEAGAEDVTFLVYPDDHGFGQSRERLAHEVRHWLLREDSSRATTRKENKELVRRVTTEGVNTGDLEVFRAMLASDYVRRSQATTGMEEIRGVEAMLNFLQAHFAAFPDWHEEIDLMIAEGDMVAYITTGTGTHTGPMGDVPATGNTVEVITYVIQRIEGGKIAETWVGWDNLAILSQLRLFPPSRDGE
jgi:uncharacterized protein